jgi:cytoskeletal protein RodZ
MNRLGAYLRMLRTDKNLSLTELSQLTKIKETYLSALETDDFAQLPGAVYVKAFLRLCARELGCDAEQLLRLYESTLAATQPTPLAHVHKQNRSEQRVPGRYRFGLRTPARYWLFFTAFLGTVILGVWLALPKGAQLDALPYSAVPDGFDEPLSITPTVSVDQDASRTGLVELPGDSGHEPILSSIDDPEPKQDNGGHVSTSIKSESDTITAPDTWGESANMDSQTDPVLENAHSAESLPEPSAISQESTTIVYPGRGETTVVVEE